MRILMIGDVFGKAGRRAVREMLPRIVQERSVDFVVANVENLCGGKGVDAKRLQEMWTAGVHVATSGNHIWDKKDVYDFIDREPRLVRPANFPDPCPGRGFTVLKSPVSADLIGVVNLAGRAFMPPVDCPFRKIDDILDNMGSGVKIRLVDFHAETTSEKVAFSWKMDGRVTAVLGTHTHVQTADERILPRGTAAISDVGMTGPHDSVIGMEKERVIQRQVTGRPVAFQQAKNDIHLHAVLLDVDPGTGKAKKIERIQMVLEEGS